MNRKFTIAFTITLLVLISFFCAKKPSVLKSFPLDTRSGVIARDNVSIDKKISSDGNGSLRIDATDPVTISLFEVADLKIDNARLLYQARIRTEDVIGQVYLEMLCHFPDRGEFFSRSQASLLTGTQDWTSQETPFLLQKGETPDIIKLNIVINGHGTVWIDDIKLLKASLK
jgi:hypothetical protein